MILLLSVAVLQIIHKICLRVCLYYKFYNILVRKVEILIKKAFWKKVKIFLFFTPSLLLNALVG